MFGPIPPLNFEHKQLHMFTPNPAKATVVKHRYIPTMGTPISFLMAVDFVDLILHL